MENTSITDVQLMELVTRKDVVAFIHTGTPAELRLFRQLHDLSVKLGDVTVVDVHADNIVDLDETALGIVAFPRLITYVSGSSDEDILGFTAIQDWIARA